MRWTLTEHSVLGLWWEGWGCVGREGGNRLEMWTRGVPVWGPRTDLAPKTGACGLAMPAGISLQEIAWGEEPQLVRLC